MTRTTNPGPRGTRERQDARPEHPPSLPSHTRDRRPTTPRAHARARPAANPRHHAQRAPNTRPRERPAEHAPTPPRANHAHQPREHATKRETRSLPPLLSFTAGPFERGSRRRPRAPGASTGYVASRLALPRHAQGQHSRGRAWPRHHAWPAQRREERAQGHAHHASSAMPLLLLPCVVVRAGWPRGDQAPAPGVQALEERPRPPLPRREPTRARKRNPFPSRPPFIQVACLVACQVGWWVPYACRKRLRGGSVGSG
jgi:hypothetical protein